MNLIATKHWEADGSAVNIDLGFIPDFAILFVNTEATNPDIYIWFRRFVDDESMNGLLLTGSSGVVTRVTTAATGMIAFDSKYHQVLVESPVPGRGKVKMDVADWASGTSYSTGERSATTIGTIVRPPTHNGRVFELTTDTGNGTSEPSSWDVQPGQTVTDGGSNIWTCRKEEVVVGGAKGLTVGATTQTDSGENFIIGIKSLSDRDAGDAAEIGANAAF